jgi:hypothetical protein
MKTTRILSALLLSLLLSLTMAYGDSASGTSGLCILDAQDPQLTLIAPNGGETF